MKVILCEKPSVARDVAGVIGNGSPQKCDGYLQCDDLVFTWGLGHLLELVDPEEYDSRWQKWQHDFLPMVPPDLKFAERPISRGKSQLRSVAKLLRQADEIVNACDAGREGELIFWRIARYAGWGKGQEPGVPGAKAATRLWLDSMTPETIRKAWDARKPLGNPEYANLAASAYSRAEADWLLGLNMTRAASLAFPRQSGKVTVKVWSVGRVQTPVLAEIVRRDRTIVDFRPETFHQVIAEFAGGGQPYEAILDVPPGVATLGDKRDRFAERSDVAEIVKAVVSDPDAAWDVSDERKRKQERPPKLFSLTSLQRHCSQAFGWTAKHTLAVAQECYETEKTLTYPRTESEFLPDDYVATADEVWRKVAGDLRPAGAGLKSPKDSEQQWHFNSKKVSDHFAIVPTGKIPSDLSGDSGKLWKLVASRFLVGFGDTAIAWEVRRTLTGEPSGRTLAARVSGKTYASLGWLEIATSLGLPGAKADVVLPVVAGADKAIGATIRDGQTQPPAPYNEASLLGMMENVSRIVEADEEHDDESIDALKDALAARGLGTPATRADIIETLIRRGFIVRQKKALKATEAGCMLIDNLLGKHLDALTKPALTADWEMRLRAIERGEDARDEFLRDLVALMRDMIERLPALPSRGAEPTPVEGVVCPISGETIADCGGWYQFPGLPDKRLWKEVAGRTLTADEYCQVIEGNSPVFDGFRSKANKPFSAALTVDRGTGKVSFQFPDNGSSGGGFAQSETSTKCPKTGEPVMESPKAWTFPGWPEVTCWKVMAGRKMKLQDYVDALAAGMDDRPGPTLKGFKSKAGKAFSAGLRLSGSRFEFDFS